MTKQEYDIIKEFSEQLHIILESLLDENGEHQPKDMEQLTSRRYSYYKNRDDDSLIKTVIYYSDKHHYTLVQDGWIKNEKDFIDVKI